jgi:superfamily II DNA or RNA helicase
LTQADEFHHAVAGNYQNIINYFEPKFLLGLAATPERLDNKDVFALYDYNIVYEVRLKDAVNKGWLVPFRYYGIYDDTQYENINNKNGKYNEKQLEKALMNEKMGTLIFKHYSKYKSEKAVGFCSSRNHAEYMAKYFCDAGIKACAVYSGESGEYSLLVRLETKYQK